jgi:hypothetical protein
MARGKKNQPSPLRSSSMAHPVLGAIRMNRSAGNAPRSRSWFVGVLSVVTLVRCGGTTAPSMTTTEGQVEPPDASEGLVIGAGASCPPNAKGQLRRCGSPSCSVSGVGQALPCKSDGDCELNDAGVLYQGTCAKPRGAEEAPDAGGVCRLDQCFTDSDCPMVTACSCLGEPGNIYRNQCLPANCRTNTDCGPRGVCSPSIAPNPCGSVYLYGFFCHGPQDMCATDADCVFQGSATSCQYTGPPSADVNLLDGATGPMGSWTCVDPGHSCTSG